MKKVIALVPTKRNKIQHDYVESGYVEIGYISPDWNVWRDVSLQNLCVTTAASLMRIDKDNIGKAFYWAKDDPTNHKHLFVNNNYVAPSFVSFVLHYMHGFMDAIGYM